MSARYPLSPQTESTNTMERVALEPMPFASLRPYDRVMSDNIENLWDASALPQERQNAFEEAGPADRRVHPPVRLHRPPCW